MGKPGQKVARVIESYDLAGLEETIAKLWSHPDDSERKSVRELADLINEEIVRKVIEQEAWGMTPSEYPPARIAYLLAARSSNASRFEDAPEGEIREIASWLESEGIDVDELTTDFVTYGVVYDYLKNYQNAEASEQYQKSTSPAELQENVTGRLQGLQRQIKKVVEQSNRSLENAGVLADIDREITVDISISCVNCGSEYSAIEFVEAGGCTTCETDIDGAISAAEK